MMFAAILHAQWKATRWLLAPLTVVCFTAPLLTLAAARSTASVQGELLPLELLQLMRLFAALFPALALIAGLAIAVAAWQWDYRAGHAYALVLPLSRARYTLLRLNAGLVLLLLPAAALLLGALLGVLTTTVPEGLHAYPFSFALRFLMATLISYVTAFTLAAGTPRTAVRLAVAAILVVMLGTVAVNELQHAYQIPSLPTPLQLLQYALVEWPGPFNVFGGSWMLIDV